MNKFLKILLISFFAVFLLAGFSMAVPFGDGGTALQNVLNGITTAGPNFPNSSVNVATDELNDANDSFWDIQGSGGAVSTMIVEIAGFAATNIWGIYDPSNTAMRTPIFAGSDTDGAQKTLSIAADGSIFVNSSFTGGVLSNPDFFGFYLDSTARAADGGGLFFSDTAQNADGMDHMAAFQGNDLDTIQILPWAAGTFSSDEWIFAWEDLVKDVTDGDFRDMVVIVESVEPVPEPATMLLLGSGLLGLAGVGRRKFFKK